MSEEIKLMEPDAQFRLWEVTVFGYGYGSGEMPILHALKVFFESMHSDDDRTPHAYKYGILEEKLGKTVTWLLITVLAHGNVITYGSSPRYGWLEPSGEFVKDYVMSKTIEELYDIIMDHDCGCMCGGKMDMGEGHELCGMNPMLNNDLAFELRY